MTGRPIPECAHYRTPLARLYLCGSGVHPGGGVMGAPGHNAAHALLPALPRTAPHRGGHGPRPGAGHVLDTRGRLAPC